MPTLLMDVLPTVRAYSVGFDADAVMDPTGIGAINFAAVCCCHKPPWLLLGWPSLCTLESLPHVAAEPAKHAADKHHP